MQRRMIVSRQNVPSHHSFSPLCCVLPKEYKERALAALLQVKACFSESGQVIQAVTMLRSLCLTLLSATAVLGVPGHIAKRQSGTSVVNLGNNTGIPKHYASGILYGIPDTANQIPDHFYTDIGFNYARAGGAQIPAPGRGWIWGLTEYHVSGGS
jgi:hypothetical protein